MKKGEKEKLRKGQHESEMEFASELLEEGVGLTEVKEKTHLSKHDVLKKKRKLDDED